MRRSYGLAVLCALALASCRTDIQSGIDEANDLLYRKQYVASERLYRKLLKRLENSGELDEEEDGQRLLILDRLGKLNALYLRDYAEAIADFNALIRFYPKTDQAYAARATVADIYHHKLGDLQAAIDAYHKLVSEFPAGNETSRAQLQIANAYTQLKNYEQARTEAEQVINRWPKSEEAAQARFQIANTYYVQGRYAEAIATYERLLEEKPELQLSALVLFELGNCFQALGQPERALAYYYACLQDHPDPVLVQRKIRRVRTRMHRARPIPEIELPDYLQERVASAQRNGGGQMRAEFGELDEVVPASAADNLPPPQSTKVEGKPLAAVKGEGKAAGSGNRSEGKSAPAARPDKPEKPERSDKAAAGNKDAAAQPTKAPPANPAPAAAPSPTPAPPAAPRPAPEPSGQ